ncbi:hypothetical protein HIM_06526 [Hirsutella minnesotensis 3608]|uniref:Carrier domain-containing protein n=1 Tax=Hirsutella minnesotensis 3608 TaxID=1043627 RepID=A0A0F7ZZE4_9HYPO|nr:hypothetical protein HIM_06526 [Hirsutella minnesotensis 3608]
MLTQRPDSGFQSRFERAQRHQQATAGAQRAGQADDKAYGRRLLVDVIDSTARAEPSRPLLHVPVSQDVSDGWYPVTYREIANAINFVAHDIIRKFGPAPKGTFPTIAYLGPNDPRYLVLLLACIKAGYQAFFVSPRNSLDGQLSLLEATHCNILYYAETVQPMVQPWLDQRQMKAFQVPAMEAWLHAETTPFPYSRPFEQAQWEPLVVLHTSGSTGIPKPIVLRQGSLAVVDRWRNFSPINGAGFFASHGIAEKGMKHFLPVPLFHAAAVYTLLSMAIYYGVELVLTFPSRPLTPDLVVECLAKSEVDHAFLPPSILEELSNSEEAIAIMKKLDFVSFGGGPMSKPVGDKLCERGINLQNRIASTEMFPYSLHFETDPKMWQYHFINSEKMGADWRPIEGDEGLFELVIKRKERGPGDICDQGCFYTFPDLDEWSTSDLYRRHPTSPHHWLYSGRRDNIIVFSNGEKLNPATIEEAVTSHPKIKSALVVGNERFQPALLIEPKINPQGEEDVAGLLEEVWPTIDAVNLETVAHGRIGKSFVALTKAEKPFPRSAKGSIQRKLALQMYEDEIAELYHRSGTLESIGPVELDTSSAEQLMASIMNVMHLQANTPPLEPDTVFFSVGVDSVQVIQTTYLLRAGLHGLEPPGQSLEDIITPRAVYSNPTTRQLSTYVFSVISGLVPSDVQDGNKLASMEELLAKYTKDMPASVPGKPEPLDTDQTVAVTGTTGSLGAYLLDVLCASPNVKKIVAMNRGSDGGRARQPAISAQRGLRQDFSKVDFVEVNLSKVNLGMTQDRYDQLLSEVDRVIHNAWPVNFNINVGSFEPQLRGVRSLVDMAAAAAKQAPIIFVSSISTVGGWPSLDSVPERQFTDLTLPRMGYGASKALGSLILDEAARQSGLHTAIIRAGQISGPSGAKGSWNKHEFFPSLVASGVHLGALPEHLGARQRVDWLTIEDMASSVLDIAGVTSRTPVSEIHGYFHAVNPCATEWTELAQAAKEFYGPKIKKLVPLEEWVAMLEASASDAKGSDLESNPSVKLLDTHREMLVAYQAGIKPVCFETKRATKYSSAMQNMQAVTPRLMQHWCSQWDFSME